MEAYKSSPSTHHISNLCDFCSNIFVANASEIYSPQFQGSDTWKWKSSLERDAEQLTWLPLHESRQIYEQGLASGCELCNHIATVTPKDPTCFSTSFVVTPDRLWIVVLPDTVGSPLDRTPLDFKIQRFDQWETGRPLGTVAVQAAAIASSRSTYSGSSEVLHLASSWLTQCTTRHLLCKRLAQPTWYPTRLLEISGQAVRLIVTSEHQIHGPYLTLSHCWGTKTPRLMLTQDTASMLLDGLPIDSLEPTYRDALDVTRSLGHKYLWIDLFCIYQGASVYSKQDWMRESVLMDRIYAGCILNISASGARDSNGGCYSHRVREPTLPSIIVSWPHYADQKPVYYELLAQASNSSARRDYRRSPVFNRGWILQERVLAPRVLHLTRGSIGWECSEGDATELLPHTREALPMRPGQLSNPAISRGDLLDLWPQVLYTYSGTQLTMPDKDKMVAVQGVSKRIAELLNDTLYFGFLASTLPQSICWNVCDADSPEQAENQSYPSWHFARWNKQILPSRCEEVDGRFNAPLLALFHNSNVDPTLPAVPEFLGCVARTVMLAVRLGTNPPSHPQTFHFLELPRFVRHIAGQRTLLYSVLARAVSGDGLVVKFDQPCLDTDLANRPWILLPVYLEGPMPALRRPEVFVSQAQDSVFSGVLDRRLKCLGLLLQRKANGDFVRRGTFTCQGDEQNLNLCVLLEALKIARPSFVSIV